MAVRAGAGPWSSLAPRRAWSSCRNQHPASRATLGARGRVMPVSCKRLLLLCPPMPCSAFDWRCAGRALFQRSHCTSPHRRCVSSVLPPLPMPVTCCEAVLLLCGNAFMACCCYMEMTCWAKHPRWTAALVATTNGRQRTLATDPPFTQHKFLMAQLSICLQAASRRSRTARGDSVPYIHFRRWRTRSSTWGMMT